MDSGSVRRCCDRSLCQEDEQVLAGYLLKLSSHPKVIRAFERDSSVLDRTTASLMRASCGPNSFLSTPTKHHLLTSALLGVVYRIEDINKSCLDAFRLHWQCLEQNNHQLYNCRPAERFLNACVFEKLVGYPCSISAPPLLVMCPALL